MNRLRSNLVNFPSERKKITFEILPFGNLFQLPFIWSTWPDFESKASEQRLSPLPRESNDGV